MSVTLDDSSYKEGIKIVCVKRVETHLFLVICKRARHFTIPFKNHPPGMTALWIKKKKNLNM